MQTTVDLEPEVIRLAQEMAARQSVTVGKLLGDTFLERFGPTSNEFPKVVRGPHGLPEVYLGRKVTAEEVKAAIEEE